MRSRNILNTLLMSFLLMAIVGVTWILWGDSLAFAPGNAFLGGLQWFGLNGVGLPAATYRTLPTKMRSKQQTLTTAVVMHSNDKVNRCMVQRRLHVLSAL